MNEEPRVLIHYRRPPDREQVFDQRVVLERDDVIVTLSEPLQLEVPMLIDGSVVLEADSLVVWFTFPGAWHDIGRFHRADGTFTGYYANVLTPPEIRGRTWYTTDLFLDVWLPPEGQVMLLDEDELERAVGREHVDAPTAVRARAEAARIVDLARERAWPPPVVDEWTLERVLGGG